MSRELIVEMIARKRALYKEEHELNLRELAIDEEFKFADEEQQLEKEKKLLALEAERSQNQLKVKRAHQFGLRLAKGNTPYCSVCFVDHGTALQMVPSAPKVLGTSLFKCIACGHELKTETCNSLLKGD